MAQQRGSACLSVCPLTKIYKHPPCKAPSRAFGLGSFRGPPCLPRSGIRIGRCPPARRPPPPRKTTLPSEFSPSPNVMALPLRLVPRKIRPDATRFLQVVFICHNNIITLLLRASIAVLCRRSTTKEQYAYILTYIGEPRTETRQPETARGEWVTVTASVLLGCADAADSELAFPCFGDRKSAHLIRKFGALAGLVYGSVRDLILQQRVGACNQCNAASFGNLSPSCGAVCGRLHKNHRFRRFSAAGRLGAAACCRKATIAGWLAR